LDWLNYHHLLYFWTVAREGSVTRAAARLRLAQPTLSGQIRKLEEAIGSPLFNREGRNLVLSDAGQVVFAHAERIFQVGEELRDLFRSGGPERARPLRIGVSIALPKLVACALIEPALHGDAGGRVICHEDKADRLMGELALHGFDLVLSDTPISPTVKVRAFNHPLGDCGISLFAAPDRRAALTGAFPGCLNGARMIMPTSNTAMRRSLDHWLERHDLHPEVVGEFEDSALLKVFGQRGAGIFPAPSIVEREVCQQYGVEVVASISAVREHFYAITLDRTLKNPLVADLCARARETLAAMG